MKKKNKKRRFDIDDIIVIFGICFIVTLISLFIYGSILEEKNYMDNFVKYGDEYLLVEIDYRGSILGAYGFISEEDYNNYTEGKEVGTIQILHPYNKGESVIVKLKDITDVQVYSNYKKFYKEHKPR